MTSRSRVEAVARSTSVRAMVVACILAASAGCYPPLAPLHPVAAAPSLSVCDSTPCRDSVVLTYLGVSGFVIRAGGNAVMTAPSFTHQNLLGVVLPFVPLHPNEALISWMFAREPVSDVSAILVGHSHYDHLLDVPPVARDYAINARIAGSPTTVNILSGDSSLRARLDAIPADSVGSAARVGGWYTAGRSIRFMALASSHAPNFLGYTYANARDDRPRTSLPRTAHGWHLGEVYAYVIDILDDHQRPVFRILYQDAAAAPQYARLPPFIGDDARRVDLAIVCAGNFGNADDYPDSVLRALHPRYVIVSHWEDFFRSTFPPFKGIRLTDTERLATHITDFQGSHWLTPEVLARVVIRY